MVFALSLKDKFNSLSQATASQPQPTGSCGPGSVKVNEQRPVSCVKIEIDFTPDTNFFSTN